MIAPSRGPYVRIYDSASDRAADTTLRPRHVNKVTYQSDTYTEYVITAVDFIDASTTKATYHQVGATGPTGPTGPTGATGATGPTGPTGATA